MEQKLLQFLVGTSMGLSQAQGVFSPWAETDPEKCWASRNPPSPQQLSLFRSEPDNTDLFWPRELSLLSMQRLAPCKGLHSLPWGRSWNTKNFYLHQGYKGYSHTSVSSLCPVASDFVTHWVFKKNLFLLHISKQTDKIAFRLWSVLYRGRRECSRSSSSRYQLQISRKELLSN